MKYRILEVNGMFTPQYSGHHQNVLINGILHDTFYSFLDFNQYPVTFCDLQQARTFLDNEVEKERIRNLPPVIHTYP